ncbi:hypothetical protein GUJ93_ZPchr0012g20177 [Zizania palustris]|uniref:Uncharacterized protein n=1 Tax=Zizania palustris TaxID=103762 RepID=A0A8J5WXA1_ZIZPA|nr:hypothetical protein GUJ93_ZPchr0012g20177 [Zizania palustris]
MDWVPSEKGPKKRKAEAGTSSSSKTPMKKVARKPKNLAPSSSRDSVSDSQEDEGRLLVRLMEENETQRTAQAEVPANVPESGDNVDQPRTSVVQEDVSQDEVPVNESGVEVIIASIPEEATRTAQDDAPAVQDLTADSDEELAFDPPNSPTMTPLQNVEESTPMEEVRQEEIIPGPSTTSEPAQRVTQMGPGRGKRHIEPLPAVSSGSTPSDSTDESQSSGEGQSPVAPKTTGQSSGPSLNEDDQQAISMLPLLAPFLGQTTGLRTLLEPLDRASRDIGETNLVAILSKDDRTELNAAIERAAYQQTVLARAANICNDEEITRLREENSALQRNFNISESRVAQMDNIISTERRARQSLEAAKKELEAERIVLRAEVEKLRAEHATAGSELVRLQEEASQLLNQKNILTTENARLSRVLGEVTSMKDALNEDKLKSEKVAAEVMSQLLDVLEYFGTTGILPSDDNITLLRQLKRIQGVAKQMKTAGIRYGELSGQVSAIGLLRYYEDLG